MLLGLAYDSNRRAAQAELDNPPIGRMIDLSDGSRLHYVERGSGPPVLLIHGALMQAEDMAMSLLGPLSEKYRTIVIDRPGHGYSTRPAQFASPAAVSMAGQARMIHEAMGLLGVEKPILVGHSVGASTVATVDTSGARRRGARPRHHDGQRLPRRQPDVPRRRRGRPVRRAAGPPCLDAGARRGALEADAP